MKVWRMYALAVVSASVLFGGAVILHVQTRYADKITSDLDHVDRAPAAIILGAGILPQGTPSDALRDRLLVGESLLEQHKVEWLLVSGDDGGFRQDEVSSMRAFLIHDGVPADRIKIDGEGYRTYESCKRAMEQGIRKAIIVTQRFHLSRALYLCNNLGMDAEGVPSDLTTYRRIVYFTLRDLAASFKAWWDINVVPPKSPRHA